MQVVAEYNHPATLEAPVKMVYVETLMSQAVAGTQSWRFFLLIYKSLSFSTSVGIESFEHTDGLHVLKPQYAIHTPPYTLPSMRADAEKPNPRIGICRLHC